MRLERIPVIAFLASVSSLLCGTAFAQGKPAQPPAAPAPVAEPETAAPDGTSARVEELEKKLAEQEQAIAELKAASEASKTEVGAIGEKVDAVATAQEEAVFSAGGEDYNTKEPLKVYGFFDLKYLKGLWDDDSPYSLYLPQHGSFMMTNLNLYFASQMTQTLDALVEIRFSFQPLGWVDDNYVTEAQTADGTSLGASGEWDRLDTLVRDPGTTYQFQQGGITIERAHMTWAPKDWFKLLAGRYLTPYGIWNIDHGSPVILGVQAPYLQLREMMPLSQTGFEIYGRFFPRYNVYLDYAVTLSNGRGPLEEVLDLDENKGLGVKLKLTYDGDDFSAALGGYGYYGKYTDSHYSTVVVIDPATGALDDSASKPLKYREEIVEQFHETILSSDLLLQFFGVRLQGELVWRRVDFDSVNDRLSRESLFSGASVLTDHLFQASFTGFGYYALAAYELPIKAIRPWRITPYVMWEDTEANDTTPYINMKVVAAGLNVKPSPYLTLKFEFLDAIPESDLYGEDMRAIQGQLAVSF